MILRPARETTLAMAQGLTQQVSQELIQQVIGLRSYKRDRLELRRLWVAMWGCRHFVGSCCLSGDRNVEEEHVERESGIDARLDECASALYLLQKLAEFLLIVQRRDLADPVAL